MWNESVCGDCEVEERLRAENSTLRAALETVRNRIMLDLGKGVPKRRIGLCHDLLSEVDEALANTARDYPMEREG